MKNFKLNLNSISIIFKKNKIYKNTNIFLENAKKIKTEFELLKGHSIGWQEWKLTTIKLLKEFVSREIELTPFFSSNGGPSEFYLKVTANLEKFLSQPDR